MPITSGIINPPASLRSELIIISGIHTLFVRAFACLARVFSESTV